MSKNTFLKLADNAYKHKANKWTGVTTKTIALMCDFSLQFDCDFINRNKAGILTTRRSMSAIKFPLIILSALSNIFAIQKLIKDYRQLNSDKTKLKVKMVGKIVRLFSDIIEILIILKMIALFSKRADTISVLPVILFMTLSQPINCYFTYTSYSQNQDTDKHYKCAKSLFFDTTTLVLTVLSFGLNNVIKTQSVPIALGENIIYVFNYGTVVSMICTLVSIFSTLDTLLLTEPSSDLSTSNVEQNAYSNNIEQQDAEII